MAPSFPYLYFTTFRHKEVCQKTNAFKKGNAPSKTLKFANFFPLFPCYNGLWLSKDQHGFAPLAKRPPSGMPGTTHPEVRDMYLI